jgi:alpha-glucosidase (family GH31 glycosyl hydrolase)
VNTFTRSIYLPKGSWTDIYTGKVYSGGRTLPLYIAPLSKIPVFINNNSKSETLADTLKAIQPYIDEINALS